MRTTCPVDFFRQTEKFRSETRLIEASFAALIFYFLSCSFNTAELVQFKTDLSVVAKGFEFRAI